MVHYEFPVSARLGESIVMLRVARLLVMVLSGFAAHSVASLAAAEQPNIVFIMADDLGWADVAFHGGNAPTPHLDRLAAEGVELAQHYVAPVCSPTRTGLMTGRCWSRFNVTNPQNERALPWETVTLPRALQAAGYDTCLTGKWHLGSKPEWGPNHFGFDHSYGSLAGGVTSWTHRYKVGPFTSTWHRNETLLDEDGHVTDLITDEAVRWLADRTERPFFLYVPFTAVHLPVDEPQEWLARVPAEIDGPVARHYAACIMHLDDAVGRIVDALEHSGRRDNTLVIFTSDNGGSTAENNGQSYPNANAPAGPLPGSNTPLRGQKGELYEGGIRVPTIVHWPARLAPGRCDAPLQITDWMPTLCALAGYRAEQDLRWDGTDVWPVITGSSTRDAHPLYWTAPGYRSRAVRDGDWKLIVHGDGDARRVELFDLAHDPTERTNRASDLPDKAAALERLLTTLAAADGDAAVED
ncbi:MAG: sulfatase [Planctomycetaceae bacterium]|nr:sulfatase [Planctomycetaceae bacterium]